MSFHRHRQETGEGYRKPSRRGVSRTVTIATRLEESDFAKLVEIARRRRWPLSSILRDAAIRYLRSLDRAPKPRPPA